MTTADESIERLLNPSQEVQVLVADWYDLPDVDGRNLPRTGVLDQDLLTYLKMMDRVAQTMHPDRATRLTYASYEGLILDRGRPCRPYKLDKRARRGIMKYCYFNTLQLVNRFRFLTYYEGYAIPMIQGESFIPVMHAWAVDQQGRVWDATWPEPEQSAYHGMAFSREEVAHFIELDEDTFGILPSEYRIGCPLLTHGTLFPEGV